MIAKCIVLSNKISVVSDNILSIRYVIKKPSWYKNKFIVFLHTPSTYNSLIVRYKLYSFYPMECLCTQGEGICEAYENFSIDPAPCRKNPTKKINLSYQIVSPYY